MLSLFLCFQNGYSRGGDDAAAVLFRIEMSPPAMHALHECLSFSRPETTADYDDVSARARPEGVRPRYSPILISPHSSITRGPVTKDSKQNRHEFPCLSPKGRLLQCYVAPVFAA